MPLSFRNQKAVQSIQEQLIDKQIQLDHFFWKEFSWSKSALNAEGTGMLRGPAEELRRKRVAFLRKYSHFSRISIQLTTGEVIDKAASDWATDTDIGQIALDDGAALRVLNPAHIVSFTWATPTETQVEEAWRAAQEQGLHNPPVPA